MCGIVGYIGSAEATQILLAGLTELEYRGYDSAGISVLETDNFSSFRAVGKLDNLRQKIGQFQSSGPVTAIGHTRWATHGKPTEANAHPHQLMHSHVVHNGIIENAFHLRSELPTTFLSETDTEVIVHLFEHELAKRDNQPDQALAAFRACLQQLQGAYAILLITELLPGQIFFASRGSPLQIGFADKECYLASSDAAMLGRCQQAVYLEDGDWGCTSRDQLQLFAACSTTKKPLFSKLPVSTQAAQKEGFRYFMEKEVYEQPQVAADILTGRVQHGEILLDNIKPDWLAQFSGVTLCACGTSYHAALVGSYLLERLAKIPARVEIASEFRYRDPVLSADSLFIVISQSGETADTLEALNIAHTMGLQSLAFCNIDNSSIVRRAKHTLLLRAGIEKGVASTKAFTAQVLSLWLFALFWAQQRGLLDDAKRQQELQALKQTPDILRVKQAVHQRLHRLSKRYLHGHGFFFIGRDIFYPLALEGALKLKEISYLHAEGYPAGEMKHGPIALADAELFTIALMPQSSLYEKIKSNVAELSARDSTIIAITTQYFELADDIIEIQPHQHPMLEFFEMLVVVQLLAMEISIRLGNDVDMPRNLAKSVTVE